MKTKIGMLLIAMCMSAMAFAQKPIEKTRVKKNFTPEQNRLHCSQQGDCK